MNLCNRGPNKNYLRYFASFLLIATMAFYIRCLARIDRNTNYLSFNQERFQERMPNLSIEEKVENCYSFILTKENVYKFVTNKIRLKSTNYLQMLNNTMKVANFPKNILIKKKNFSSIMITNELHIKHNKSIVLNGMNVKLPIITAMPLGRLGNVMGEYATLFALGKLYNVTVFMHPKLKNVLNKIFPYISMKDLPSGIQKINKTIIRKEENDFYNYYPIEVAAAGLFGPKYFILKDYPFEIQLFNAVKKDVIEEFKFSPQILLKANNFLSSIKKNADDIVRVSFTYIGVHLRNTDYKQHLKGFGGILPGFAYMKMALNICRRRYKYPLFIAVSDDLKSIKRILKKEKDVYFSDKTSPELDMAILSSCNHSIFTVGSFGFWSSYLAGGDVIYADVETKKPYRFSKPLYEEARLNNFIPIISN